MVSIEPDTREVLGSGCGEEEEEKEGLRRKGACSWLSAGRAVGTGGGMEQGTHLHAETVPLMWDQGLLGLSGLEPLPCFYQKQGGIVMAFAGSCLTLGKPGRLSVCSSLPALIPLPIQCP